MFPLNSVNHVNVLKREPLARLPNSNNCPKSETMHDGAGRQKKQNNNNNHKKGSCLFCPLSSRVCVADISNHRSKAVKQREPWLCSRIWCHDSIIPTCSEDRWWCILLTHHAVKEQQWGRKEPLNETHRAVAGRGVGGGVMVGEGGVYWKQLEAFFFPLPEFSCSPLRQQTQRQIHTLLFSYATQGETSA